MNRKLRLIYEDMKLNPDDAVFSIGDAVEIINAGSGKTIRDYDTFGITNFKKNPRGDRIFSRNDIEYLKNLRNLNDCGFKLKALKFLVDYLKSKKQNPVDFINNFSSYCTRKKYFEKQKK